MGMIKNYLLKLLERCSEERFGQDAIEWAVVDGLVPLSYRLDWDVRVVMSRYDEIIEAYRRARAESRDKQSKTRAPMKRAVAGLKVGSASKVSKGRKRARAA